MELTGALEATRARWSNPSAWQPSTSQPTTTVLERSRARGPSHRRSVFVLWRNGEAFRNSGGICCCCPPLSAGNGALLRRREPLFRFRARGAQVSAEVEVGDEEVPNPEEAEEGGELDEVAKSDEEDFGIDEDGNLTASLPPEFLELMKDEGPPLNYWLIGFGLTVVFLARKSIWKEFRLWGKLVLASGHFAWDAVILLFKQLIVWGGDPLAKVIVGLAYVGLTINKVFRLIADIVPPLPILYAITLASIVLLVGESVSDTYSSSETQFPSRRILDTAGLLGLGGFVGVLPVEITLLGIAAITFFLLFLRKVNPVAGFTPAAAVFAAVAEPIIRYPVFFSFVGSAIYRYWKLGYLSSGAVQKERTSEYPRILIALLYLVGLSCASRVFFFTFDRVLIAIKAATFVMQSST